MLRLYHLPPTPALQFRYPCENRGWFCCLFLGLTKGHFIVIWLQKFVIIRTLANEMWASFGCLDWTVSFFLSSFLIFIYLFGWKIWTASRICVSSLRRGHTNLCIVPILVYVLPKRALDGFLKGCWARDS